MTSSIEGNLYTALRLRTLQEEEKDNCSCWVCNVEARSPVWASFVLGGSQILSVLEHLTTGQRTRGVRSVPEHRALSANPHLCSVCSRTSPAASSFTQGVLSLAKCFVFEVFVCGCWDGSSFSGALTWSCMAIPVLLWYLEDGRTHVGFFVVVFPYCYPSN